MKKENNCFGSKMKILKKKIEVLVFNKKNINDYLVFWLISLLILLSIIFENRSLFIGYLSSTLVILAIKFKIRKKTCLLLIITLIAIIYTLAFSFKLDSTKGRILIYKLSLEILKNNFPQGIGAGNFNTIYGEYQIKYFEKGKYSQQEFLLADNIVHCYNDFLEVIIEYGLIGIISIIINITAIIMLIKKALKVNEHPPLLLLLAISQIVCLGIASIFTFIFYQTHWQLVVIISLLLVIYYCSLIHNNLLILTSTGLIVSLSWIPILNYVNFKINDSKFEMARNYYKAGYYKEANLIFNDLYAEMANNSELVRTYCRSLISDGKYEFSKKLLYKLINRENSHFNYDLLAYCFKQQNDIKKAEKYYWKAIYKTPNRFITRYNLFKLYLNTGQIAKAKVLGKFILEMPIKIPSPTINYIQAAIKTDLNKIVLN